MAGQSVLHEVRLAGSLLLKFWPDLPFKCIVTAMCRREKLFAVTFVGFTGYNIICCFVISPFSFSSIYHALARKYLKTPRGMDIKVRKGKLYWYSFGLYFIFFLAALATGQHSHLVSRLVREIIHSRLKTVGELPRRGEDPKADRSGPTAWAQ